MPVRTGWVIHSKVCVKMPSRKPVMYKLLKAKRSSSKPHSAFLKRSELITGRGPCALSLGVGGNQPGPAAPPPPQHHLSPGPIYSACAFGPLLFPAVYLVSQPLTAAVPRLLLGLGGWGWGVAEPGKEVGILFFSVLFQMCILHTLLQPTLAHLPTTPANHRSPTDLFSD